MFTRKQLFELIIPLIMEQILMSAISALDVIMVSALGEQAISGVSLITSIDQLVLGFFSALATGGSIVCSQYIGSRNFRQSQNSAGQLLLLCTVSGLAVFLFCLLGNKTILHFLYPNAEIGVTAAAQSYFIFAAASYPLTAAFSGCAALLRSVRRTKASMVLSTAMNISNFALNALFLFVLKMGVAGAGLGSVLSRAGGLTAILFLLIREEHPARPKLPPHLLDPRAIITIFKVGIPAGLETTIFHIGKLLVQGVVTSYGTAAIAANAAALTMTEFSHMPGAGIGLGMTTVTGQCIGAEEYKQAKTYTGLLMKYTYISMGIVNILLFLLAAPIMGLYHLSPDAATLAASILRWHSVICILLWPSGFTLGNGLRAAGDVAYVMWISIVSMWIFRVGCSFLFLRLFPEWNVLGVWFAMFLDWAFRAACFLWRFASNRWMTKRVI